jgi:hypothetical protein
MLLVCAHDGTKSSPNLLQCHMSALAARFAALHESAPGTKRRQAFAAICPQLVKADTRLPSAHDPTWAPDRRLGRVPGTQEDRARHCCGPQAAQGTSCRGPRPVVPAAPARRGGCQLSAVMTALTDLPTCRRGDESPKTPRARAREHAREARHQPADLRTPDGRGSSRDYLIPSGTAHRVIAFVSMVPILAWTKDGTKALGT